MLYGVLHCWANNYSNNCEIGANAFVNHDLQENSIVINDYLIKQKDLSE